MRYFKLFCSVFGILGRKKVYFLPVYLCLSFLFIVPVLASDNVRFRVRDAASDASQAATMISSFSWSGLMKQEAGFALFGRLCDPQNLHMLIDCMKEKEQDLFMDRLGILGSFHPKNPTSCYSFNLQRQVRRRFVL